MSGTPPPNYNPNDSLLSGGDTVKIMPVQGGGFMPGGNYNADASLLSGGEDAKIIAVQGGGAKTEEIYKAELAKYEKDMKEYTERKKKHMENYDRKLAEYEESRRKEEVVGPPPQKYFPESPPVKPLPPNKTLEPIDEENVVNGDNIGDIVLGEENEGGENEGGENEGEENEGGENEGEENEGEENESTKEKEAKPLETPCPALEDDEIEEYPESFEATEDTAESKTKEIIRLVSREFFIRQAKRKSAGEKKDDEIMKDWKEGKFTEDEADFLNILNLSPKLLYSSFYCHQKDWKEELAEFLYYLSLYTCYPASSLVLKGECQRVREFLRIVESNLKAEQLRKLAEKPIPVAGPITLRDLEDQEDEEGEEGEEGEGKGNNNNNNNNSRDLGIIKERMGKLNADDVEKEKERKSVASKVASFFRGFFKGKPAKKNAEGEILKELEKLNNNNNLSENTSILNNEDDEDTIIEKRKEKIKRLKEESLEEAFQDFLTRIPPEFRNMNPEILKKKYLSKAF